MVLLEWRSLRQVPILQEQITGAGSRLFALVDHVHVERTTLSSRFVSRRHDKELAKRRYPWYWDTIELVLLFKSHRCANFVRTFVAGFSGFAIANHA